jgi:hypothetical protein
MENGILVMNTIEGGQKQKVSPIKHENGGSYESGSIQFAR